eukprot:CFRG2157T1
MESNTKNHNLHCERHTSGYDFCVKHPPLVAGVYLPEKLKSTSTSRRGHHEMSRQVQRKIAAQNIRDRQKAYDRYLIDVGNALDSDNEAIQKKINVAKMQRQQLLTLKEKLLSEIEKNRREKENMDALLSFHVSDLDSAVECYGNEGEEWSSPQSLSSCIMSPNSFVSDVGSPPPALMLLPFES